MRVIEGDWPRPPDAVREIAAVLARAGHEVWCVGGAVRDALLGEPHLDWDLATSATPDVVRRLFRRTVPLGIEFGTVGVLDAAGAMHEVTTFRHDVQTDGRHAVVDFGASLEEDLARRDLTINAIAVSPDGSRLADPFGGRDDLARRVVRAVGVPAERMVEDRLRALRAIRFAARFGFTIEPATWQAIVDSAPHLGRLSAERVKQEIEKTLEQVTRPSEAFAQWRDCGAFATVVPACATLSDAQLATVDAIPRPPRSASPARVARRRLERLAALSVGMGATGAATQWQALRFSKADQSWVSRIVTAVEQHAPALRAVLDDPVSASSAIVIRRVAHDVGRLDATTVVRIAAASWVLTTEERRSVRRLYRVVRTVSQRDPVALGDLALDGDDLRAAGVSGGPAIGGMLKALLALVLEDPSRNTRERLLAEVRARLAASTTAEGIHVAP